MIAETETSTALEAAFDAIERAVGSDADESQRFIAAKCRALMVGYDRRWAGAPWDTISVEEIFHLPIVNPETEATSRTFTHAGKFDGVIRYHATGREWLLEHKTVSEDIEDPNAPYWRRLTIDSQVSAYMLANWQNGRKLEGTLYDCIRKPSIRPKKIAGADQTRMIKTGLYCETPVPKKFRLLKEECLELYEVRLTQDVLSRPEWYFQRRPIPRLDSEVLEFAGELWDIAKAVLDARNTGRHFLNDDACMNYGTPCQFLGICSGHDNPDSANWTKAENVHPELTELDDKGGRSVLTNTRLRTFKTCRRKHYYRYEIGLKRSDEEERESLYFGRVLHEALAAWWLCFER